MSWRDRLLDLQPLRASRSFREIWAASVLTGLAAQIAAVAALTQVWALTGSPVWTGAIGLAQGVPLLLFGLIGGSLADRHDRRSILLIATLGQTLAAVGLTIQAAVGADTVWPVMGLLAVNAAASAIGAPARRTLPVRLLPAERVPAGLALQNVAFQATMLIGPAIGGVIVAWSVAAGYAMQVLLMPLALVAAARLSRLRPRPSPGDSVQPGGWRFPLSNPTVRGVLLIDLATTSLSMPIAIFPLINALRFDDDPRTLGLFLSAIALGGIVAGATSGAFTRAARAGLIQLLAAITWGLALVGFGLSSWAPAALGFLVLAGAADTIGVVIRGSMVQLATPDALRGRVSAVDHVIGVAGPEIGNMRGGILAAMIGAPAALVIGGLSAALAATFIGIAHPQVRRREPAVADAH